MGRSGMFQRLPNHFHYDPLLGIHALRFARGNTKELVIEVIHVFDKATVARHHFAGRFGISTVVLVHIPTIGRNLANRVGSTPQAQ